MYLSGRVTPGDRRGRELGFPTANFAVSPRGKQPREGVYAGYFTSASAVDHPAAVSVGRRPTFYRSGTRLVEAYLLDFDGDLYGQEATVELIEFLRPQLRFDDIGALLLQMRDDVRRAREITERRNRAHIGETSPRNTHPIR